MARDLDKTYLYHITDVENLPAIVASGGLRSDVQLAGGTPQVIGYSNIKNRRMTDIRVPCCGDRFVGEFVPFYFCPRSPMLFTVNRGNTGRPAGCQRDIVHLVTTVARALSLNRPWAFSNGNAGAYHADFFNDLSQLDALDWGIINSNDWSGDVRRHRKAAEFLVSDFFDWPAIGAIGCHNAVTAQRVSDLLKDKHGTPKVVVRTDWYYG